MENSVITLHRRVQLCRVTSGDISSLEPITHVAFGDGGIDADGNPIMPSEAQTELSNRIATYPIDGITYPVNPQTTARYTVSIPAADLPNARISEAALVDSAGNLCAIKNFLAKGKDAGIEFVFEFDDRF